MGRGGREARQKQSHSLTPIPVPVRHRAQNDEIRLTLLTRVMKTDACIHAPVKQDAKKEARRCIAKANQHYSNHGLFTIPAPHLALGPPSPSAPRTTAPPPEPSPAPASVRCRRTSSIRPSGAPPRSRSRPAAPPLPEPPSAPSPRIGANPRQEAFSRRVGRGEQVHIENEREKNKRSKDGAR